MRFQDFPRSKYSRADRNLMRIALEIAAHSLKRHPRFHENANRLAQTVMTFYDQGIRDINTLAAVAANLEKGATMRDAAAMGEKEIVRGSKAEAKPVQPSVPPLKSGQHRSKD